jgi:hypothetical protein
MHHQLSHRRRRCRPRSLAAPPIAILAAAWFAVPGAAPAAASASPAVTVTGSSVLVVHPPLGLTTVTASRPDALTGKPVVIGRYTGTAVPWMPFSVNTTAPTPLRPDGDCWQRGALASALTPDLLPGDTVTVTGSGGPLGGATPWSTAVTVAPGAPRSTGPTPECAALAPLARTVVTGAPARVDRGAISVSGRAQPLAGGVSIAAGDGSTSTAPVSVTPSADGTWSATIPADAVAPLRDGTLTLRPVVTVRDLSTGAPAHVAGAPLLLEKDTRDGGAADAHPSSLASTVVA